MRLTSAILAASLVALAVPAFAAAHHPHFPCTASKTLTPALPRLHVDFWDPRDTGCLGAAVSSSTVNCSGGLHVDDLILDGLHVFALMGPGCQTGVVLETSLP